jgi:hypothetical protein
MKRSFHKKYLFTQLSAPVVGAAGVFLFIHFIHSVSDFNFTRTIFHVIFFGIGFIIVLISFMILWGRILVWLGILTREEARGYPYSKPWETLK